MRLSRLTLVNFKNIAEATLEFSQKINCFLGNNGMGKSNLLDAIYTLSFTKSFYRVNDSMLIRRGEEFMMARGTYSRAGKPEELQLGLARGKKKSLKRSGKEYTRLSKHIGLFPLVMVSPHDIDLIRGAAEERRRWSDIVISQTDSRYLDALMRYNHALEQRNHLLRDGSVDHALYDAVEIQLEMAAEYITAVRRRFTDRLSLIFGRFYRDIAGDDCENVAIAYDGWDKDGKSLKVVLDSARRHDEAVRHTSVGPHRDDFLMILDGMDARRTGSQGQCKTFTAALRLAQYTFLSEATGLQPLLLLDDIFDKLDANRVERIMKLVTTADFGQIFITDTNRSHLDEIVAITGENQRLWLTENGVFTPKS